ncbi:MAG: pyridoxal phosphate-dependent aminotransferase [Microvirga sp.]
MNPLFANLETSVFEVMSRLARETGAVNLGQGFPDDPGPADVREAAARAVVEGWNQYPPMMGLPELRQAVAAHYARWQGVALDPEAEVMVTSGATEAIAGALLALIEPGDEVVLFEPMYDSYQACIALAGAVAKPVTLRPPNYAFDPDELRAAITPKTKLMLINTPHNPTGHVLSTAELQIIADLAIEHDLLVITDEVYEHLVFDGFRHTPLATLPGMRERTLVISSGGKTFNTTGWKIGWICAPPPLLAAARTAKQFLTYVSGAPFQPAIAVGLGLPDQFFVDLAADLEAKRDHLFAGLVGAGFTAFRPEATYFTTVDIRPVAPDGDGYAFCRRMPEQIGVVAIPNQVFYANQEHGRHLVRFACCKRLEVIDAAVERLSRLSERAS